MSKYEPLRHFLEGQTLGEIRVSFSDLERILGFKLPPSQVHRAWWSNNPSNNVMTKAWLAAGYETAQVDIDARKLVFRRVVDSSGGRPRGGNGQPDPTPEGEGEEKAHPLMGWMKGLTTIAPGVDLTEPSDPDWGKNW